MAGVSEGWTRVPGFPLTAGRPLYSEADVLAVFERVFVFRLGARPPQSTEGAGGRPLTERSKTLGLVGLHLLLRDQWEQSHATTKNISVCLISRPREYPTYAIIVDSPEGAVWAMERSI